MNLRYELLKRVITNNNPYVKKEDMMLLNMNFFTNEDYGQIEYDELNSLLNPVPERVPEE